MILITGGAGYIGSIVAERLITRGETVCVYDNLRHGHRDAIPEGALFVEADLADRDQLRNVLETQPIRTVIHFAALTIVGESMRNPALYFNNNLINTLSLLEEAHRVGVNRLVFSSSCAIFGNCTTSPISEQTPTNPTSPYGESKLVVEKALHWYRRIYDISYFSLRFFNACGASKERGERHKPETHLVPCALNVAMGESDVVKIFGTDYPTPDGTCIRDYIHVEDLADAHICAIQAPAELSGCYNVGTGKGHSVREVIDTVRAVTGRPVKNIVSARREGDPAELVANPTKIQRDLNWRAQHDLGSAIYDAWEFKMQSR